MAGFVPLKRRLAVIFAALGFMGVSILGLAHRGAPEKIMIRALVAMLLGYIVGWVTGHLGEQLAHEAMPPEESAEPDGASEAATEEETIDDDEAGGSDEVKS